MSTDTSTEIIEAGQDILENTVEAAVETVEVVRNNPVVASLFGAAGLIVGAAVGYFVAKKKLEAHYDELLDKEISEAKAFYKDGYLNGAMSGYSAAKKTSKEEEIPEEVARTIEEYQVKKESPVKDEEKETTNVFGNKVQDDLNKMKKDRNHNGPYVITHEEFLNVEPDYEQMSMSYFIADRTLVDDEDRPVEDPDAMVGDENLTKFGVGSGDPNVVYVRNERFNCDYEIIKTQGSYLEEVLGLDYDESTQSPFSNGVS